ncbi:hypothetical protein LCGC14_1822250 [marine sediment metagenome]|uniref:Uncharacterized protein n=1 Tax=marine sediment metagenome TaxID=412755 RepID=A0A0F9IYA3_9ZZZZ
MSTELNPGQIWKPNKEGALYELKDSEAIILLSRDRDIDDRQMYWTVGVFHFVIDGHFDGACQIKLHDKEIVDNATFIGNLPGMICLLSLQRKEDEELIVDVSKPPIPPPLVTMRNGLFGSGETRKSKELTIQWEYYINKYGYELRKNDNN